MEHLKPIHELFKKKEKNELSIELELLISNIWLKKIKHDIITTYYEDDGRIHVKIQIFEQIISNTKISRKKNINVNYKEFKSLLDFIESKTDLMLSYDRNLLNIDFMIYNVEDVILELGSKIESEKYNI